MEYEEKGDGQHGAAGAPKPKRAEDIARQILQGVSELGKTNMAKAQNVAQQDDDWKLKVAHLDELMRKAPCITVDVFVASVRAVFGDKKQ